MLLSKYNISFPDLLLKIRAKLEMAAEPCYDPSLIDKQWPRLEWLAKKQYDAGLPFCSATFSQDTGNPYTIWGKIPIVDPEPLKSAAAATAAAAATPKNVRLF